MRRPLDSAASRRRFLAGGGAAAALLRVSAVRAAQFEFTCGTTLAADHPGSVRTRQMWSAVERESGGRIRTQFFPGSALGSDPAMLSQLRLGALPFFLISFGNLAGVVPPADIANLGFAFKDASEALRIFDGPLGDYVRRESAAKGIYALPGGWDAGMFQIASNSHPVRTPAGLRGFRIRVLGKMLVELFKALGASPTPLNAPDVYTGLQTRLIDGTSAPLVSIQSQRWYEVSKSISLTNHAWSGSFMVANDGVWRSLPADLQAIVERNNARFAAIERRDMRLSEAAVAEKLVRQGLTLDAIDQAPFRAPLTSYYASGAKDFGETPWRLLETSLGRKLA